MLPARNRLRDRGDFASTMRSSRRARAANALLVLHASTSDRETRRVGFVVSKSVGNAVTRNRVKRRLRALMAARIDVLPAGTDLVVRANAAAARSTFVDLGDALDLLLKKVGGQLKWGA